MRPPTPCTTCGRPSVSKGRCAAHTAQFNRRRGDRGYGGGHRSYRASLAPRVAAGEFNCARCGEPIGPGDSWDLGHTPDRLGYIGPEHSFCNRSDGGKRRG